MGAAAHPPRANDEEVVMPPAPLVLIIEDHEDTLDMYAGWLTNAGRQVAQARTAGDALEKVRTLQPALIATDLGLQGSHMDGWQLAQRIKSDPETNGIPIIAVTAWAQPRDVERARQAGCDTVLVKPCLPDRLLTE